MNFSSLEFIFLFMPLFFAVYYLLPHRMRNAAIFLGSLIFYAIGTYKTPAFIIILAISTIINYLLGILIELFPRKMRLLLSLGVIWNIGSLFIFKYARPLFGGIGTIASAFMQANVTFNTEHLALPIGLSFFAFRAVAYLADVGRGLCTAERSPLNFAVFMCMFPTITAGPITSYRSMQHELCVRSYSAEAFCHGARLFISGLAVKALVANSLSACWSRASALGYDSISTPLAWIALICYALYIYFDFCGYSLMAIGAGRMLGFGIPENFRDPYLSLTMSDFWRRWHITLGEWFKEYIYIPLGGNRFGIPRTLINMLAVWLFTGMWHGSSMNFLLWGLVLFLIVAAEKFIYGRYLTKHRVAGHIYMAFIIPLTWAVFAISDLPTMGLFFTRLFPFLPQGEVFALRGDFLEYLLQYGVYIAAGLLLITPIPRRLTDKLRGTLIGDIVLAALLLLSVIFLIQNAGDPFMYGSF